MGCASPALKLAYTRDWCLMASIPAFQAGREGSNPLSRSSVYISKLKWQSGVIARASSILAEKLGSLVGSNPTLYIFMPR